MFPLPVPLTVSAFTVLVASFALGMGGLWADDSYLTNLLSAVTGFAGLVLVGGSALDYLASRAQWSRTRPARLELADDFVRTAKMLCDSVSEVARAAGDIPVGTDGGDDLVSRCDGVVRSSAVVLERLEVIQSWFLDRAIDRMFPPEEPVRREGLDIVVEFTTRLERWVGNVDSEVSDVAEIWLPELISMRTDRQASLGRQLALVRAANRDLPSVAATVEACGLLRPIVSDLSRLSDLSEEPGEVVLMRWLAGVVSALRSCRELARLLRDDP